jgi:hypothetical protein
MNTNNRYQTESLQTTIDYNQVINNVMDVYLVNFFISCQGHRVRDRMVVEFTSTYAIST